jgi:putative ABC transport system ATP-binding protein
MPLLEIQNVAKRRGPDWVLRDLTLSIEQAELVAIWGQRRSGRSTLLRLAAGLETPDAGIVRLAGHELDPRKVNVRASVAFVRRSFKSAEGDLVSEQLIRAQLARGIAPAAAQSRVHRALERAGAGRCGAMRACSLDHTERVRVAIARALCPAPDLLVIDEPTLGIPILARDEILLLLRAVADEGTAVLMSVSETAELSGADRALWLRDGSLGGELEPYRAQVLELRPQAASA